MTVGQLKQLIREALNNIDLNEMPRIADKFRKGDLNFTPEEKAFLKKSSK